MSRVETSVWRYDPANGDNQRLPALAADIVALKLDVIVTNGEPPIRAMKGGRPGRFRSLWQLSVTQSSAGFAAQLARPWRQSDRPHHGRHGGESGSDWSCCMKPCRTPVALRCSACPASTTDPSAWRELAGAAKSPAGRAAANLVTGTRGRTSPVSHRIVRSAGGAPDGLIPCLSGVGKRWSNWRRSTDCGDLRKARFAELAD